MARIAGVDIPREKRVDVSLRYIYGIGPNVALQILSSTGIEAATKVRDLTDEEVARIREWIDANLRVEGELRREVDQNRRRKIEIQSYQGRRHLLSLPVRGQRTKTNARTRKGPKKTVGGKKKKVGKKG